MKILNDQIMFKYYHVADLKSNVPCSIMEDFKSRIEPPDFDCGFSDGEERYTEDDLERVKEEVEADAKDEFRRVLSCVFDEDDLIKVLTEVANCERKSFTLDQIKKLVLELCDKHHDEIRDEVV